jgi:hypothetical protein
MPAPEQTYFPSALVRLIVRFDEFGSLDVQKQSPKVPLTVLRGITPGRQPLVVRVDSSSGVARLLLAPAGASASPGGPQAQTGSADRLTWAVAGIIPKRATWQQNGIRTADTLSATIKFIDCPIDPRTIRSCAVEFYAGTVTADEFARGVAGETRTPRAGSSTTTPLNVIPETWVDAAGQQRTNLRFQGFVDKWTVDWDDEEEPVIQLECRDNTQLLIDTEVPAALTVSPVRPIDRAVADYLANFPAFSGLAVEYRPAGATPPSLGTALAGTAFQPHLGPAPAKGGGAAEKMSVWDYLTDVAGALGHNIRVEGTTIVIEQVQTLLSNKTSRRADDPFKGRTVDGQPFQYRRFIWGRNLKRQQISRNFTKHAPTNIEVRAYSTRRKKDLVVRFPDPATQRALMAAHALPGDAGIDQKWLVWKVRGIEDVGTLKVIAQNVYQSVGRNEFSLQLETKNLASFGGDNLDPDVLDLLVGDTFELLVARDQEAGALSLTEDGLMKRGQDLMQALGFDAGFAAAYSTAYTAAGFQTLFRLRQMVMEWDAEEEGISLSIHGCNYIEVRVDQPFA